VLESREAARKLEEVQRGLDVVLDKGDGRVDGVVDVGLGGNVQDALDLLGVRARARVSLTRTLTSTLTLTVTRTLTFTLTLTWSLSSS